MATRKCYILCTAGIIRLLDRDVLEGPGGQARELGLASVDNRPITDSKAGGHRIKAVSQEGQSGSDTEDGLGKEGKLQISVARKKARGHD